MPNLSGMSFISSMFEKILFNSLLKIKMRKIFQKIFLTLLASFHIIANAHQHGWFFNTSDVNHLHHKHAEFKLFYGKAPLQFGYLRLPYKGKKPYPVAVIIHGGCWLSAFANVENTETLADALREEGIATWNIEYRRINNANGGWPNTFKDVGQATDYLRQIAPHYRLDLKRVIAIGHSSGGHLALWLGGRHKISYKSELYSTNPLSLKGIVVLAGVTNLYAYRNYGINVCGGDVVAKLLGNKNLEKRYKETSPSELLPLKTKQFLIYGIDDRAVPITFAHIYLKQAKKMGDNVRLISVQYTAHHEYLVPNTFAWPIIKSVVENLVNENNNFQANAFKHHKK